MAYFLNLFNVNTWREFQDAGSVISGHSIRQRKYAESSVKVGDVFICYLVGLSRWCGILKIVSDAFIDDAPIFNSSENPYVVRFRVLPDVVLEPLYAIPITEDRIWSNLIWTKNIGRGSASWGSNFQRSLRLMPEADGVFLERNIKEQALRRVQFPFSSKDQRALRQESTINTSSGRVQVAIPDDNENMNNLVTEVIEGPQQPRDSHEIQCKIAEIGAAMGLQIWLPKADRERVRRASSNPAVIDKKIIDMLPMNYDDATMKTIEQIDVIWIRKNLILRAFEVEHSTAIYSGILRMADLIALQPNNTFRLHIVAPENRSDLVLAQINRPVFSYLESGPLANCCTLLTYKSIKEIYVLPKLNHSHHTILDDYEIFARSEV